MSQDLDVLADVPAHANRRLSNAQREVKKPLGWSGLEDKAVSAQGLAPFDLPPEARREVMRVHVNTGHPDKPTFLRALKHAGAKKPVLRWTKDHFK